MAHHNPKRNRSWKKGKGKKRENRRKEPERIPLNTPDYVCPFCNQQLRDIGTAIGRRDDGAPSHFDCVINDLTVKEDLETDEKIIYLGNGSFGIVRERPNSRTNKFFIRKRIQYEPLDRKFEWRRDISEQVINRQK